MTYFHLFPLVALTCVIFGVNAGSAGIGATVGSTAGTGAVVGSRTVPGAGGCVEPWMPADGAGVGMFPAASGHPQRTA